MTSEAGCGLGEQGLVEGLLAVVPAAGAEPLFPSHPTWSPAFMVSPAQARPETFPNSLESHNGEGSWEAWEGERDMRWTGGDLRRGVGRAR